MPLQEQAELWMALRDRMKENWTDLTLQEKKAGESYFSSSNMSGRSIAAPGSFSEVDCSFCASQSPSIDGDRA